MANSDVARIRTQQPRRILLPVGLFFSTWLLVQISVFNQYLHPQTNEPFPLTRFAMFIGRAGTTTDVYYIHGITPEGTEVRINPFQEFRSLRSPTLFTRWRQMGQWVQSDENPRREMAEKWLKSWAVALRRSVEERGGPPLNGLRLKVTRYDIDRPSAAAALDTRIIWETHFHD